MSDRERGATIGPGHAMITDTVTTGLATNDPAMIDLVMTGPATTDRGHATTDRGFGTIGRAPATTGPGPATDHGPRHEVTDGSDQGTTQRPRQNR